VHAWLRAAGSRARVRAERSLQVQLLALARRWRRSASCARARCGGAGAALERARDCGRAAQHRARGLADALHPHDHPRSASPDCAAAGVLVAVLGALTVALPWRCTCSAAEARFNSHGEARWRTRSTGECTRSTFCHGGGLERRAGRYIFAGIQADALWHAYYVGITESFKRDCRLMSTGCGMPARGEPRPCHGGCAAGGAEQIERS